MYEHIFELLEEIKADERAEGKKLGEIRGQIIGRIIGEMKGLICAYKECHVSDKEIVEKLMEKYCFNEELEIKESERYVHMCKALRDMILEAEEEGEIIGKNNGKIIGEIKGAIVAYSECRMYEEEIVATLIDKYALDEEIIRDYIEEVRNSEYE